MFFTSYPSGTACFAFIYFFNVSSFTCNTNPPIANIVCATWNVLEIFSVLELLQIGQHFCLHSDLVNGFLLVRMCLALIPPVSTIIILSELVVRL